ncbi:MAG: hypothetical protein A2W31_02950 [Planctomycetes bacterium RBG_16_64_10]|nr:MAG: hypothetical protein A2W31_02950 [Planctomycetes bacterium RBG_16_64_10]
MMLDFAFGSCSGLGRGPRQLGVAWTALLLAATAGRPAAGQARLQVERDETAVSVRMGDQLCLRYRFGNVPYKPYVEQLLTPQGVNVLRDAPHDHLHHHALMFAVAVEGVNFWEEQRAPGRQARRGTGRAAVDETDGISQVRLSQQLDWIDPRNEQPLLQETRTIVVYAGPTQDATLVTWQARLAVPAGRTAATLTGSPYFGLGVRFVESMDDGGQFQNANGATRVAGTNNTRSAWCAYQALANGKPVTLAMFDHPENVRFPATWYTMGDKPGEFAYLSGTLNLKQQPLTIAADHPLALRYGVALWDGQVAAGAIEKAYRWWVARPPAADVAP